MKKVFIVFLVFAYLNCYMGCAANKREIIVSFPDLDKSSNDFPLEVVTHDSVRYYFDADMYRFLGDTLDGIANVAGESERVKLASSQIVRVKTQKIAKVEGVSFAGLILVGIGLVGLVGIAVGISKTQKKNLDPSEW